MSQQSISGCRVCETLHNLCSPFINPPPPCYYLKTIPYSLLNPCLQDWCHKEHHSAALHIPQSLTSTDTYGSLVASDVLTCIQMHMNAKPQTARMWKRRHTYSKLVTHKDNWISLSWVGYFQIFALHNSSRTEHCWGESTAEQEVAGESGIGNVCASWCRQHLWDW